VKVGDLVAHKYGINRDIECVGMVIELLEKEPIPGDTVRDEALVVWASENVPRMWHYQSALVVINESR
jgi:hypothetical protein